MDNYTSDSSDNESSNRIIDLAYLLRNPESVDRSLGEYFEDDSKRYQEVEKIILHHNELNVLPKNLFRFTNIKVLDLSNNGLTELPDLFRYCQLTNLVLKNNRLTNGSLPKEFTECPSLRELNFGGNHMTQFPEQIFSFANLRFLYLGGNGMRNISKDIWRLKQLQVFSLGGNDITEVPVSVGTLKYLQALVLCDNQIEVLPANIANLHNLRSLLLHKNRLRTLPPEIIALRNLNELSLRDNPLVVRFVSDITYQPTSLLELSARSLKLHNIKVEPGTIPKTLAFYLDTAHRCVNPHCKGVYFDNRVEHIKFVDFCGKYRIPLLQYLCSSKCASTPSEEIVRPHRTYLMKKVLLG
ncbi:leucine-rich repeat-containing protein 58 [Anthonomus grandis grandis]|uniref:leucine-rich repeat-containing protein 58 n=1 Tax=Anthonomus grandis grandis TaxID=2921223 RepID=UPI002166694A|nr:leucine-rich repeat-containing protein 58 [Anthonomus grandis grandis]XP_050299756.1 leucine-rich repeat-containing protein 58 [Anthonomus grandis grandis]